MPQRLKAPPMRRHARNRLIGANSDTLVTAYETRLRETEEQKTFHTEKVAACAKTLAAFDQIYRSARTSLPFKALGDVHQGKFEMVPPHGIEPRTY